MADIAEVKAYGSEEGILNAEKPEELKGIIVNGFPEYLKQILIVGYHNVGNDLTGNTSDDTIQKDFMNWYEDDDWN